MDKGIVDAQAAVLTQQLVRIEKVNQNLADADGREDHQDQEHLFLQQDGEKSSLRAGEVRVAGATVLTVTCDDFTMEMNDNESTDHENLGGDPSGQSGA